ncbi:molecular chaperone [Neisseriaceae bacterium TC5R-5]|nr:molecular chaperone [Neisseriaceae bacterium TC5R-5]
MCNKHRARWSLWLQGLTGLILILLADMLTAGVMVEKSRVVFSADRLEQSFSVLNSGQYPLVAQVWVDEGQANGTPELAHSPLLVLPPIFRLEPGRKISLRLVNTATNLPQDRESLFWLNLYEVPPAPTEAEKATSTQLLAVTMRTQMKVFIRPVGLAYPATALPDKLTFSLKAEAEAVELKIDNPTPYYATVYSLQLSCTGISPQQPATGTLDMVAPLSSSSVQLNGLRACQGKPVKLQLILLDDDGNAVGRERESKIE